MKVIKGDASGFKYTASKDVNGRITGAYLSLNMESAVNFFRSLVILNGSLRENSMGLYSFGTVGRLGKVKFASMSQATPHMLRPRGNTGCIWDPIGRTVINVEEYTVSPVKYQGEFCVDTYWGTCFEALLGVGNDINELTATPESRAILMEFVNAIYDSLSDSVWNLAWYAGHPLIEEANTAGTYNLEDEEWDGFVSQQNIGTGGWLTLLDAFKDEGRPNYNVQIGDAEVATNGDYVGDVGRAGGLFERMRKGSSRAMRTLMGKATKRVSGIGQNKPIFLVTEDIFRAYETELQTDWANIPETMYYHLNGEYCAKLGCVGNELVEGVLKWHGHLVVNMEEWSWFFNAVGVEGHVALLAYPGVLGMATDVAQLDQTGGLGMLIEQKRDLDSLGKIQMATNFDIGMGITQPDLLTYASKYIVEDTALAV